MGIALVIELNVIARGAERVDQIEPDMRVSRAPQHFAKPHRGRETPIDDRRIVEFVVVERQIFRDADVDVFDAHSLQTAGAILDQLDPLPQLGLVQKMRIAIVERAVRVRAADQKQPAVLSFINPGAQSVFWTASAPFRP